MRASVIRGKAADCRALLKATLLPVNGTTGAGLQHRPFDEYLTPPLGG
jgi:hypothetical protein